MRHIRLLALVLLLATPRQAFSQIAVFDAANEVLNAITSVQTFITALQTVLLVADSITNLTGGGTVSTGGEYAEDIALLQGLLTDAQGLSFDLASLNAQIAGLLDLGGAPSGLKDLQGRMFELRNASSQAYLYALRVQTLIQTGIRIATRIMRMVDALAEIVGNLSGHQNANDQVAQLNQIQVTHNSTVTAFQRAETTSRATEILVDESIQRINAELLRDWPRP